MSLVLHCFWIAKYDTFITHSNGMYYDPTLKKIIQPICCYKPFIYEINLQFKKLNENVRKLSPVYY